MVMDLGALVLGSCDVGLEEESGDVDELNFQFKSR